MTDNSDLEVYHRTRKIVTGGSDLAGEIFSTVAILAALFGFPALIFAPPLGLLMLIGAGLAYVVRILVGQKHRLVDYCDACGNEFSATTLICPHCQARIITPPPPPFWSFPMKIAVWMAALFMLLILGLKLLA
jgi:hypothetical protein